MASSTPTDQQITADVFDLAATTGRIMAAGLVKVEAHSTWWFVSIKPGTRATIKSAGGYAARLAGTDATPAQDQAIRTRMLFEVGGRW